MILKHRRVCGLLLALFIAAIAAPSASALPHEQLYAGAQADQRGNPTPKTVVQPAPNRFDWGDAGIGAGAGFALTAIGLGGALIVSNRRHREARSARTA
jgi:hypothetical protein